MNLPKFVQITEVGPRDGFQNISTWIPTEVKVAVIKKLLLSGIKKMEVVSFASPKKVPQMADAQAVLDAVRGDAIAAGVAFTAFVPNMKGAVLAQQSGLQEMRFVLSVSEQHSRANINQTVSEALQQITAIRDQFPDMLLEISLATCFGCAFQGKISSDAVIKLAKAVLKIGADKIELSDTIGAANPLQVEQLLLQFREEVPNVTPTLHFHDTCGMGLANVLAALQLGYTEFDSSIGGLGGCPFAPGATGNISTEDLNNMLTRMGIVTGIDQAQLMVATSIIKEKITSHPSSHLANTNVLNTKGL